MGQMNETAGQVAKYLSVGIALGWVSGGGLIYLGVHLAIKKLFVVGFQCCFAQGDQVYL